MNSHCNLEVTTSVKIVKYLFKYIHKDPDHARVGFFDDHDRVSVDIKEYVSLRYISASEAIWRILEFDVSGLHPNVIAQPVHLPNKDVVILQPGDEASPLEKSVSKLRVYFQRPDVSDLSPLTFLNIFEQYTVCTKPKTSSRVPVIQCNRGKHYITKRTRGQCVARMHRVSQS